MKGFSAGNLPALRKKSGRRGEFQIYALGSRQEKSAGGKIRLKK
jgi:hypothetical protein